MHGAQADNIRRIILKHSYHLTKSGICMRAFHVAQIHIHRNVSRDSNVPPTLENLVVPSSNYDESIGVLFPDETSSQKGAAELQADNKQFTSTLGPLACSQPVQAVHCCKNHKHYSYQPTYCCYCCVSNKRFYHHDATCCHKHFY